MKQTVIRIFNFTLISVYWVQIQGDLRFSTYCTICNTFNKYFSQVRETGSYEPLVFKFYNNKIYTRKGIIYNGVVANYTATAQLLIKKT